MNSLKHKTVDAMLWRGLEIAGQQGIRFIVQVILARLLLPEQFGLIGMLTVFILLAQALVDSGFASALIQKKNASHVDECSIFYFNILISVIMTGILWLSAPWIAAFYRQPLLTPLTRVLSLSLVINAFAQIQRTLLVKSINFKSQLKVEVTSSLFSGVVGVVMAYRGFGVWALVGQQMSRSLAQASIYWVASDWRPALIMSISSLKSMFSYGSKMLLSGLLSTAFENIYLVVIGKLFTPAALGFYSGARRLQMLPVQSISSVVTAVTFPIYSSIQDDTRKLKVGVQKSLCTLILIIAPTLIGLGIVAKPLVVVLLTEKWLPCVPFLQLLCIAGVFWPLSAVNLNVLKALGRSDLFFRLEVLKKILAIISIVVTYRWGIQAMIYGHIVVSIVSYYLNSYYSGKLLSYPIKEQIIDLAPYVGTAILMGIGVYSVQWLPLSTDGTLLAAQVVFGISIYTAVGWALRMPAFVEVVDISRNKLGLCKIQP